MLICMFKWCCWWSIAQYTCDQILTFSVKNFQLIYYYWIIIEICWVAMSFYIIPWSMIISSKPKYDAWRDTNRRWREGKPIWIYVSVQMLMWKRSNSNNYSLSHTRIGNKCTMYVNICIPQSNQPAPLMNLNEWMNNFTQITFAWKLRLRHFDYLAIVHSSVDYYYYYVI